MAGEMAQFVFTDPPYNVPITGHVSGLGRIRHREFRMARGELSRKEFTSFLEHVFEELVANTIDGSIHQICMDWRHMSEMIAAGEHAYTTLMNVCIWNKTNGGMGSFYRSKHELVFVWKNGKAAHINNIELGRFGRSRTNVWDYAGVNSFGARRLDELASHPTTKPVALVADAIKDCSRRDAVVLDPFAGSGTLCIACENTGRRARLIEIDPIYCDVIIRRWQDRTGKRAVHAASRATFERIEDEIELGRTQIRQTTQGKERENRKHSQAIRTKRSGLRKATG
jgi:DNA modification methylase